MGYFVDGSIGLEADFVHFECLIDRAEEKEFKLRRKKKKTKKKSKGKETDAFNWISCTTKHTKKLTKVNKRITTSFLLWRNDDLNGNPDYDQTKLSLRVLVTVYNFLKEKI